MIWRWVWFGDEFLVLLSCCVPLFLVHLVDKFLDFPIGTSQRHVEYKTSDSQTAPETACRRELGPQVSFSKMDITLISTDAGFCELLGFDLWNKTLGKARSGEEAGLFAFTGVLIACWLKAIQVFTLSIESLPVCWDLILRFHICWASLGAWRHSLPKALLTVRYYFLVSFSWISLFFDNCMHMYSAFWVYSLLSSSFHALFCPPTHTLLPLCSFLFFVAYWIQLVCWNVDLSCGLIVCRWL